MYLYNKMEKNEDDAEEDDDGDELKQIIIMENIW